MNYIGNIIKEYRNLIGMSRKGLAKNICSEKYVYLIEKGNRTPSSLICKQFGDRMGVDLFKYYEYLSCKNPIAVEATITCFNKCRRENDMEALKKATDDALTLPDFQKIPWVYEIENNRLSYMTFKEQRCHEVIKTIKNTLNNLEEAYKEDITTARFYVILSTCYQMLMDIEQAKKAVRSAEEIISSKQNILKYTYAVIAVKINKLTLHYISGELDDVIDEGHKLNQYQVETSSYELGHHGLFYLAYAYYQKGLEDVGIMWFQKALYATLIRYKATDVFYLAGYAMFRVLIDDVRMPSELVSQFKKKYNIT
ncbi:helix-turn-helix transcriptional regulator [Acetobacterium woodii]|uniref:HTH cro/C1-type domain-containing protein n=1 Tax=Acetobacterium woodii (strain ATCC 29683 / DSM 1030 / JCM 2381 / KCTC 1655 / WB1) TaxID=931626 RepID=H6LF89_ACEWD|nr:helix-turn-helix transcriptional regulator [Acetobacterium woodii]AFA48189.1 hypothetical protein Awo_c14050 [Acetobacterium woodii DSM 1030]